MMISGEHEPTVERASPDKVVAVAVDRYGRRCVGKAIHYSRTPGSRVVLGSSKSVPINRRLITGLRELDAEQARGFALPGIRSNSMPRWSWTAKSCDVSSSWISVEITR